MAYNVTKKSNERSNMAKTETVIVRMDQELKDRLEAYASVEGVGLSEAVRRLVAQIPVIGKIPSPGKITLTDGDHVITIDEAAERR